MGNYTILTIDHDRLHDMLEDGDDLCRKIYDAAVRGKATPIQHGRGNLIETQDCKHGDNKTAYVLSGNALFEMNPFSRNTERFLYRNPTAFKDSLEFMRKEVSRLEAMLKNYEKDNN